MVTYEITGGSELLATGICVHTRAEEFIRAKYEEGAFPICKDIITVDPSARLGSPLFVVRVSSTLQGARRQKVGEDELFICRVHA
jgi:hypothetical protein